MGKYLKKSVGIVSCNGEEFALGNIARNVGLQVLYKLRKKNTVTICLPLFRVKEEDNRLFARIYPTIAIDGCNKQCAFKIIEKFSKKPEKAIIIEDILALKGLDVRIFFSNPGRSYPEIEEEIANEISQDVDELLGIAPLEKSEEVEEEEEELFYEEKCECGINLPGQILTIDGKKVKILALPLIFKDFFEEYGKLDEKGLDILMEQVCIYNEVPEEMREKYRKALKEAYLKKYKKPSF